MIPYMVTAANPTYGTQEHYIDGGFRASAAAETFESLNPSTNEVLALAAAGEAADVDLAVGAARRAFDDGPGLDSRQLSAPAPCGGSPTGSARTRTSSSRARWPTSGCRWRR